MYAGIIVHYMGIPELNGHMDRRALLTEREREVLRGDADDVENVSQYQSKIRTRIRNRIKKLSEDLELLQEHEPELATEMRNEVCGDTRIPELEQRVEELEERVAEQ